MGIGYTVNGVHARPLPSENRSWQIQRLSNVIQQSLGQQRNEAIYKLYISELLFLLHYFHRLRLYHTEGAGFVLCR